MSRSRRRDRFRFPWREGNRFRLLVDGDHFFPEMVAAIDGARHFVLLEFYLVASGAVMSRFIDALVAASGRGVRCHLLMDDFGARRLTARDRERLARGGVAIAFYNPLRYGELRRLLLRDHRKLLICDGEIAFVGGTGLVDEFDPAEMEGRAWHEVMVAIEGPCVGDWITLFEESWPGPPPLSPYLPQRLPPPAGAQRGRVTVSQMSARQEIKRSLVWRIGSARARVWCSTAYFVPSWKIRWALGRAARRGVDVRLMLPGPCTDHPAVRHAGRRFYHALLRQGVRIFEYQPSFTHAKVYLCDGWVSIGSSNVDRWNLLWNLEANQEIDDAPFATEVEALFEADFGRCQEITLACWQARPWHRRLVEWFWGRVAVALLRLSLRWRRRRQPRR